MAPIRSNKQLLSRGTTIYAKKKSAKSAGVDELGFDKEARQEYLTGFHKRKVQRKEKAQEVAAKKAREARIEERKKLREERKAQLEEDLKNYRLAYNSTGLYDIDRDRKGKKNGNNDAAESDGKTNPALVDEDDFSDWEGIAEKRGTSPENSQVTGILKKREFYEGDDSEDEEAMVVIEEMNDDVVDGELSSANGNYVYPEMSKQVLQASIQKAKVAALQASIYGFPEPSIYRDEDDPLGLNDEDSDDDQKSKSSTTIDIKDFKNGREQRKPQTTKKRSNRYLTKTERMQNAHREKKRNQEKRSRAKDRK